jgi:hypothetical protein
MKTWLVHKIPHGGPTKGYIQNVSCPRNSTSTHHGISVLKCKTFQNPTTYNHEKSKNQKHVVSK